MSYYSPHRLRLAIRTLRQGGVIAYPTEAVYGLGCDPWNAAAVQRLLALKNRSVRKGLIVIAVEIAQLTPFLRQLACAQDAADTRQSARTAHLVTAGASDDAALVDRRL